MKQSSRNLLDGIHFLNFIPKQVSEHTQLVSFDIVSLYSNIPHDLGLEAISFWLDKYPELIANRYNKAFITEALKIVLENNIFSFNNNYFKQIKGTAMGTKVAPTHATLVLAFLEEKMYKTVKIEKGEIFAKYIKEQWKRFLDDCFIFWERSMIDFTHKEVGINITPFISTYNPKNREVFGILKANMNIFKQDNTMNRIMKNTKFIKGKRQLPNLRRILMKSELNENNTPPCVSKCNEPRCGLCKSIIEGSCLNLKDKTFHVKENMNCTVRNVLYVLICNGCKEYYIGQTGDKLRNRKTVHEQQIRDPSTRQMPVSKHIDNCCKTQPKFSLFPFYKFQTDDVSARLAKERYFIDVFSPKLNMF